MIKEIRILKKRLKDLQECKDFPKENKWSVGYNKGYEICIEDLEKIISGEIEE